jgi:hypothetical protein
MKPGSPLMKRKMLLGLKERAGRLARDRGADIAERQASVAAAGRTMPTG